MTNRAGVYKKSQTEAGGQRSLLREALDDRIHCQTATTTLVHVMKKGRDRNLSFVGATLHWSLPASSDPTAVVFGPHGDRVT